MNLFEAIDHDDRETATTLIAADLSLTHTLSSEGATPVLYAMYQHHFDLARLLANQVVIAGGALTLAEAAAMDDVVSVTTILGGGEPVDRRAPDGFTPLQLAAYFGAPKTTAALLEAGADVNAIAENPMQIQPLHAAAAGRHTEVALALIAAGAEVTTAQRHGWTPLHAAASHGDTALVEALLAAGASTSAVNDDGARASELAAAAGHAEIADRLS